MKKRVLMIAAVWLALIALVRLGTDPQELSWAFEGGQGILLTAQQAQEREDAYALRMAQEKQEAAQRAARGEWGKEDLYAGAPETRPGRDDELGLNLMWGEYDVTVTYRSPEPVRVRVVSAGRQPFIEGAEHTLPQGDGAAQIHFILTDSAEQVALACDLPQDAAVTRVTVRSSGAGVFSRDLAAYAALAGAVLTALLLLRGEARRRDALALALTALFASMPLLFDGLYGGHDLFFHLNRVEGIASALRAGQLPARIHASTLLGYGYASGVFYPELFLYLPAVLRNLGVSLCAGMKVLYGLINLAVVCACYASARALLHDRRVALGAAVLYALCPYRLAGLYTRAALGEALAMIFFPLVILAMAEVLTRDARRWPLLALGMTGLLMSHLLSAMFAAVCCALAALCCARRLAREPRRIGAILLAAGLTALCALWFLVPMLDYTLAGGISTSVAIDTSAQAMQPGALLVGFAGAGAGLPEEALDFSYSVGVVPGLALLAGCALLAVRLYAGGLRAAGREDRLCAALLLMGALLLACATPLFPWAWACSLRRPFSTLFMQIQYPWRLVGVAAPMLSLAAAWGYLRDERHRTPMLAVLAAMSVTLGGFAMQMNVQDVPVLLPDGFCDTRIGQYEYTYEGTEKSALVPGEIVVDRAPGFSVGDVHKQGTSLSFTLNAAQGCAYVEVPLLYYPGYRAEADGVPLRVVRGDNNVIRLYGVQEGSGIAVRVWFEAPGLWLGAQALSVLGAALLALSLARMRKRRGV
ncbi:MAG: hypothetical protein ACI4PG_10040 [Candidatus Ventricola sp.]